MILCDDIIELLALVPDKKVVNKDMLAKQQKVGKYGCTVQELQNAQKAIKERLLTKYKNVQQAIRAIDTKGDGLISRDEVVAMLHKFQLIKHTDYYTGAVVGEITMACADTLIDLVDNDKSGTLNYNEFTRVIVAEDIMTIPEPKSTNPNALWGRNLSKDGNSR